MDTSKALVALSFARTALDDPGGLPVHEMSAASQFGDRLDGHMVTDQALKAYAIDKIDEAMQALGVDEQPRSVLVHLNVEVPASDDRDAEAVARSISAALEVGLDDDSVRGWTYSIPLAEEVG